MNKEERMTLIRDEFEKHYYYMDTKWNKNKQEYVSQRTASYFYAFTFGYISYLNIHSEGLK